MKSTECNVEDDSFWKEISTHDNSSIISDSSKGYIKRCYKSYNYLFPIAYFVSSLLFLIMLLAVNILGDKSELGTYPLAGYHQIGRSAPCLYGIIVTVIALTGFLNIWLLSSLLIRRFSVPELSDNKSTVNIMFIIGVFSNIIFTFFGFAHKLLEIENENVPISLGVIIFSSFIFYNILYATCVLQVLNNFKNKVCKHNKKLSRSVSFKRYTLYLSVLMIIIYLSTASVKFYNKTYKAKYFTDSINILLFTLPFALFVLNAFINLSYYVDIKIIEESINMIVDKDIFLNDDSNAILLNF
jgi:hypothetical protein